VTRVIDLCSDRLRFVTHYGIDTAAINEALDRIAQIAKPAAAKRRVS
jgi:hypothetical protein